MKFGNKCPGLPNWRRFPISCFRVLRKTCLKIYFKYIFRQLRQENWNRMDSSDFNKEKFINK